MNRVERWAVWTTSAATILSGVVYLWMKYLLVSEDPYSVVNHPLEPWALKVHVLVSPLLVFALGLIALKHVVEHLRRKVPVGRRSGLLLVGSAAPMVLSGYWIQVLTDDRWVRIAAWVHIAAGLLFAFGVAAHGLAVLRARNLNANAINSPQHARSLPRRESAPQ